MSGSMSILTPIGWALLHFVWQGVLVALALASVLWLVPARAARIRYALACLAFAAMALMPIATLIWLAADPSGIARLMTTPAGADFGVATTTSVSSIAPGPASSGAAGGTVDLPRLLPWLSMIWVFGVACCAVRLAGGWWQTRRLLRRDTSEPDGEWRALVSALSSRIGLRRAVRVLASARIDVPVVAGAVVPVLLLPVSALSGLTPGQLEAVIAHELAHIRRHDYLINLVQSAIECLLFYHPAVWWVSHVIRVEREHCCDDLAVMACGDPLLYARALTNMEALRRGDVGMAMAASGGSLLSRVRRLVGARPPARVGSSGWVLAAMTVLMVAGAGATNWVSGWAAVLPDVDLTAPQPRACCPSSSAVAAPQVSSEATAPTSAARAARSADVAVMAAPTATSSAVAVGGFNGPVTAASPEDDVASVVDLIDALHRSVRDLSRAAGVRTRALERLDLQRQLRDTARQLRTLRAARATDAASGTRQLQLAARAERDRIRQDAAAMRLMTRGRALAERAQRWCQDRGVVPPTPPAPPAPPSAAVLPPPPAVAALPAPPLPPAPKGSAAPRAVQPLPPPPPPASVAPGAPGPVAVPQPPPPPAATAPVAPYAAPPPLAPVPPAVALPPPPPAHPLLELGSGGTRFMSMSEDGHSVKVYVKGRVELTDASDDVKRLEAGGYFMFETGNEELGAKGRSKFSATPGPNGTVERSYVVDGRRVGPEEGREWLARTLPAFVRDHASPKRLER